MKVFLVRIKAERAKKGLLKYNEVNCPIEFLLANCLREDDIVNLSICNFQISAAYVKVELVINS